MIRSVWRAAAVTLGVALGAGCSDNAGPDDPAAVAISGLDGQDQDGTVGSALALPLRVVVTDDDDAGVAGVSVTWTVASGGGSVTPTSVTDDAGVAAATFTLGPSVGTQSARASVTGLDGSPVTFTADARPIASAQSFTVSGGGNNVPNRFTSDLWVHGGYAYTGTWGTRGSVTGNALNIWQLSAGGAPMIVDSIKLAGVGTVSDVEVSADGQLLLVTTESGPSDGLYLYALTNPASPTFRSSSLNPTGLHTGTFATIGGKRYVFAATNPSSPAQPSSPALAIYDVSDPSAIAVVTHVQVPSNYGIHDTFVRDGIAFVFAWNTGVIIYDVGNGIRGGTPAAPVEVSRLAGPQFHNGWWFHNPANSEKRYLFVGQEGPGSVGAGVSSGDIHVVDVSNLAAPVEVATYRLDGAGAHNFWMDEAKGILYAAYYNGGVVALDVKGTLAGNLAAREIARIQPGGPANTFTWGVQLYNGSLYASDMLSGLWQLGMVGF